MKVCCLPLANFGCTIFCKETVLLNTQVETKLKGKPGNGMITLSLGFGGLFG